MVELKLNAGPSVAQAPDLDWSQVRETVRMMELAAAQINLAMRDGDDSIGALSNSFTSMLGNVDAISSALDGMECDDASRMACQTMKNNCNQVKEQMQLAIVAFQFYDRLSQQLAHVVHSLDSMGNLVGDSTRLYNPFEWKGLQETIRSRYSMQEEQEMFDALLSGSSVEEALSICEKKKAARDVSDDVELFF